MTVGEQIKALINAESYLDARLKVSDEFVDFVRDNMPSQYEYFKEKEEAFKSLVALLGNN